MKTVMDAVNEFKCEWEKKTYTCEQSGEEIALVSLGKDSEFPSERRGFISRGVSGFDESKYSRVCNEREFNALVSAMETNFGESESYSNYKVNYEMINDDMKPVLTKGYSIKGDGDSTSQPVFTQAMADNGICPDIGAMFQVGNEVESDSRTIDFKGLEVEVIGLSKLDDDTVITFSHPTMGIGCGIHFESWVKPIDIRTDKEKAIDDLMKESIRFINVDAMRTCFAMAYDKWVGE